ncbi:DegV family protein [Mycoplasma sp. 1018B]|uniref:DegV family protein n=1 Tax=Mycoplasma sp. 1018B TaxID=2967302 RepID=UPI00211B8A42|nr:DegV family protein [Mycoplasma sp. 1018B]UUM19013.1 DegV family protein [Mycoplasma sp. 1018B]
MKKIGYILDSFSCINQKEAQQLGYGYFPFIVEADGNIYNDGIDLTKKELLEIIEKSKNVKTSLPNLQLMENIIKKMCQEYDIVVYLPIAETLSGAMSAANNFTQDYKNFYILKNRFVANQYLSAIKYIDKLFQENKTIENIQKEINKISLTTETYIIPTDLNYLINGGRISNLKKFLLKSVSKMKLTPYIKFHLNDNSPAGIARGYKGAALQIIDKLLAKVKNSSVNELLAKFEINFIYGINKIINEEIKNLFSNKQITFNNEKLNTSVIAVHTGPDAVAISIMPKLEI